MQSGKPQSPAGDNDKNEIPRRHRPAFVLWAVLLASFLLVVSLYAKFGEPFVVKVYELQQISRARIEGRSVASAIIDYEDYLRVDPESIRVRGLIVNALIESRKFEEAEEHAKEALSRATEAQRPLSWLIAARVYLARGDSDEAAPYVQRVLDARPASGEGHYQMAQLHLARGQSSDADQEFRRLWILRSRDSTKEYIEEWNARSRKLAEYQNEIEAGVESAQRLYDLGMEFQKMGRLHDAQELYSKIDIGAEIRRASGNVFEIAAFEFRDLASLYVDFAFGGAEIGTPLKPYNTLSEALAMAEEDATINLDPGNSAELLTINQNVTLRSTGGSTRIGVSLAPGDLAP